MVWFVLSSTPVSSGLVALVLLFASARALAQDVTPPRVTELPDIEVPEGEETPESVEVRVLIAEDGHATVEECGASEAICALVRSAIEAARFEPARRGEVAIPARIAVRLGLHAPPAELPPETPPVVVPTPQEVPLPPEPADEESFHARAEVQAVQPGMRRLTLQETRDLPGAFGDPFRAIDALPGVTPVLSGLPYFYVRGAPPSGTLYMYDDIPVPALYHLAAGPAVIHPRMVGPVRLYSGVPPARYGRLVGGAVVGEGPEAPTGDTVGELELRLLDISGFLQAPVGDATVSVAGRYGYPGLLLSIFSPEVDLAYWDYQTRVDVPLSSNERFQLVWFGSFDRFTAQQESEDGTATEDSTAITFQFHRTEARYIRRFSRFEMGTALRFGFEESSFEGDDAPGNEGLGLSFVTLGPRMWLTYRDGTTRMRLGTDFIASSGGIDVPSDAIDDDDSAAIPQNQGIQSVPGRSVSGLNAELVFRPLEPLSIELGLRADLWISGGGFDASLDPRVRAILTPEEGLDLHLALGVTRQPAVFFVPLPGLSEIALDYGLQTAIQAETGVGYDVLDDLRAELQLFLHRYDGLLFPDLFFTGDVTCTEGFACPRVERSERTGGTSYGGELFVRKPPGDLVSGFLSYTLAWADVDDVGGIDYTPSYDVRHVLNAVALFDLGGGFTGGARLHVRSGKVLGQYYLDVEAAAPRRYEQRLPSFVRLDVQVAYAWETSYGHMRLSLEFFNATLSREAVGLDCPFDALGPPDGGCEVEYTPAIFFPNLGLRADFQ